MRRYVSLILSFSLSVLALPGMSLAEEAAAASEKGIGHGMIAVAAALGIGFATITGTLGFGRAISAGLESIGRNPAAGGKVQTAMIIGLVFIELAVILSFVIALQLIGKV
jgi:F-type H+-transporting ATPase subunit c